MSYMTDYYKVKNENLELKKLVNNLLRIIDKQKKLIRKYQK